MLAPRKAADGSLIDGSSCSKPQEAKFAHDSSARCRFQTVRMGRRCLQCVQQQEAMQVEVVSCTQLPRTTGCTEVGSECHPRPDQARDAVHGLMMLNRFRVRKRPAKRRQVGSDGFVRVRLRGDDA